ncbi:MAG: tRNA pseudouridine(13) synthase TruD [bacterium]
MSLIQFIMERCSAISWIEEVKPKWPKTLQEPPVPDIFILDEELGFKGKIKQKGRDFQVSEILAQEPLGTGPNTFLRIKKKNISTLELIEALAEYLDREIEDFCVAEYKGPRCVAIQWISLEHLDPRALAGFDHPEAQIIQISRSEERLKPVNLKGNRFEVIIRDVDSGALEKARRGLELLKKSGAPNWFGGQCFGYRKNRHLLGWALIKKKWEWFLYEFLNNPVKVDNDEVNKARKEAASGNWKKALELFPESCKAERAALKSLKRYPRNKERACSVIPVEYRRFFLLALQGYAFNDFLARRIDKFDQLVEGDVAFMHGSEGCFPVVDPRDERPRMDRFEISPTGPMFGEKFLGASKEMEDLEDQVIERLDLTYEDFQRSRYTIPGRRRPLRAPIAQTRAQMLNKKDMELGFFLPRSSYATVIIEELMHRRFDYDNEEL